MILAKNFNLDFLKKCTNVFARVDCICENRKKSFGSMKWMGRVKNDVNFHFWIDFWKLLNQSFTIFCMYNVERYSVFSKFFKGARTRQTFNSWSVCGTPEYGILNTVKCSLEDLLWNGKDKLKQCRLGIFRSQISGNCGFFSLSPPNLILWALNLYIPDFWNRFMNLLNNSRKNWMENLRVNKMN